MISQLLEDELCIKYIDRCLLYIVCVYRRGCMGEVLNKFPRINDEGWIEDVLLIFCCVEDIISGDDGIVL